MRVEIREDGHYPSFSLCYYWKHISICSISYHTSQCLSCHSFFSQNQCFSQWADECSLVLCLSFQVWQFSYAQRNVGAGSPQSLSLCSFLVLLAAVIQAFRKKFQVGSPPLSLDLWSLGLSTRLDLDLQRLPAHLLPPKREGKRNVSAILGCRVFSFMKEVLGFSC